VLEASEIDALEKKLAEKERVLKRAQAIARLGYWKYVPSTGEVDGSEELFRIFGLNKDETDVDAFFSVVHPDDVKVVETTLQRCVEIGERMDAKFRLSHSDGTQTWLRTLGEAITDESGEVIYLVGTTQDITDIESTNRALRESELWMKSIFNSLDEAVLVVSPDRELINVNKAAETMFGYSIEEIFNNSTELFHVDHQHYLEFGERIRQAFAENRAAKFEFEAKRKNGEIFPTEHTVSLLRNVEGEVKGIVSVVKDITEQKLAEKELFHLQGMLEEANKAATMGAWEIDLTTNELIWNAVTKEIHEVGLDYEPDVEAAIHFYKEGQNRDTINRIVRDAMEKGGSWDEELVIVTAKGREKWVRAIGSPEFRGGTCVRLYGSFQDITQRKLAEQEFERMFELSPDLLGMGNMEGYFTRVNSSFEKLLGYSETEIMAKPFLEFVHEDDVKATLDALMAAAGGKRDIFIINRYVCKDGSLKWIEWDVLALSEENKFYATGRDITERKAYEAELEKYRYRLEDLVAERTRELKKSLAEKEVLLKEVHHRVKNNMAMVSAFIHLQINQEGNESSLEALKSCEARIQSMSMVHKRLYQSSDFTNIDMRALFDDICDALYKKTDSKNINVEIRTNDIHLEMDAAIPCALIVNELFSNSLKYAYNNDRTLEISIFMGKAADGRICVLYSDNGGGMPDGINMENTNGLGLQLIKVFVDQLNGEIKLHNNGGVNFEILFPERINN